MRSWTTIGMTRRYRSWTSIREVKEYSTPLSTTSTTPWTTSSHKCSPKCVRKYPPISAVSTRWSLRGRKDLKRTSLKSCSAWATRMSMDDAVPLDSLKEPFLTLERMTTPHNLGALCSAPSTKDWNHMSSSSTPWVVDRDCQILQSRPQEQDTSKENSLNP